MDHRRIVGLSTVESGSSKRNGTRKLFAYIPAAVIASAMGANNGPFGPAKFRAFNAFGGLDIHLASNGIQMSRCFAKISGHMRSSNSLLDHFPRGDNHT